MQLFILFFVFPVPTCPNHVMLSFNIQCCVRSCIARRSQKVLDSTVDQIHSRIYSLLWPPSSNLTHSDRLLKFAMVGDSLTNKPAMLNCFSDEKCEYPFVTTIGVDFVSLRVLCKNTMDKL